MRSSLKPALFFCLSITTLLAQTTPPAAQSATATDPGIRTIAEVNRGIVSDAPASFVWSPDSKRLTYVARRRRDR